VVCATLQWLRETPLQQVRLFNILFYAFQNIGAIFYPNIGVVFYLAILSKFP